MIERFNWDACRSREVTILFDRQHNLVDRPTYSGWRLFPYPVEIQKVLSGVPKNGRTLHLMVGISGIDDPSRLPIWLSVP